MLTFSPALLCVDDFSVRHDHRANFTCSKKTNKQSVAEHLNDKSWTHVYLFHLQYFSGVKLTVFWLLLFISHKIVISSACIPLLLRLSRTAENNKRKMQATGNRKCVRPGWRSSRCPASKHKNHRLAWWWKQLCPLCTWLFIILYFHHQWFRAEQNWGSFDLSTNLLGTEKKVPWHHCTISPP